VSHRFAAAALVGVLVVSRAGAVGLGFPRLAVPPGGNVEACVFLRLEQTTPLEVVRWAIVHHGVRRDFAPRHFLVYAYTGTRLREWPVGQVIASRGCLDLGPIDLDHRYVFAAGASRLTAGALPRGVALRVPAVPDEPGGAPAGVGLLFDAEWVNAGTRPRVGWTRVRLYRPRRHAVRRWATPIFADSAGLGLEVAPGRTRSTEASTRGLGAPPDAWAPAADACVLFLSGHFHQRGRFFGVDLIGSDGAVIPPARGFVDPYEPGRTTRFGAVDYTDPGFVTEPLAVAAGQQLHYFCWHDNGVTTAVRLGCEVEPGVPPGRAIGAPGGGPSVPCTSAADCTAPGLTGRCVPANLTAGVPAFDEVCALAGASYAAAPGGGCDVSALPPID
jgi:hypothetical protein